MSRSSAQAKRRQQWLLQQLEGLQHQPAPPSHSERQLVRSDVWLQLEALERSQVLAWAEQLGPEVLRAKGDLWLADAPHGPVSLDVTGPRLSLAAAPSRPWPSPLQRRGQLVVISRANAAAPRWPVTVSSPRLIPA